MSEDTGHYQRVAPSQGERENSDKRHALFSHRSFRSTAVSSSPLDWAPVNGASDHMANLRVRQKQVMVDNAPALPRSVNDAQPKPRKLGPAFCNEKFRKCNAKFKKTRARFHSAATARLFWIAPATTIVGFRCPNKDASDIEFRNIADAFSPASARSAQPKNFALDA